MESSMAVLQPLHSQGYAGNDITITVNKMRRRFAPAYSENGKIIYSRVSPRMTQRSVSAILGQPMVINESVTTDSELRLLFLLLASAHVISDVSYRKTVAQRRTKGRIKICSKLRTHSSRHVVAKSKRKIFDL
jgi:hypothetical protein